MVSGADGLLRKEAHCDRGWIFSVWTFCISPRLICFFYCCHPCILSSSSVARAYFFLWTEGEKNNDRFGFVESLRSFVPREIRKFIKCAPAEVLKRGRKCLSFIFIHEALEGDGKGDWRLGDQAHLQSACADTFRLASPGCRC